MKIIKKPWGHEIIYAHDNGHYLGKKLFIKSDESISLQNHVYKHETFFLDKGSAKITIDDKTVKVCGTDAPKKRAFVIEPLIKHRITAITDCIFLESSTDYPDDVRRYEDKYGR